MTEAERMATLIRPRIAGEGVVAFDRAKSALIEFVTSRRAALEKAITVASADAQPLRGPVCLQSIGNVSGSFSTTWGSVGAEDPFASGKGVLQVTANGVAWQHHSGFIGAVAGSNPDPTATRDSQLIIPGLRSDGMLSVLAFGFDQVDAVPGTLSLDLERVPGVLLELNPSVAASEEVVGVVTEGTLVFDSIGSQPSDSVVGRFEGELYSTPFLNGF